MKSIRKTHQSHQNILQSRNNLKRRFTSRAQMVPAKTKNILLSLLFALGLSAGHAQQVTYDPTLGTLPDAQGFTRIDNGGDPAATVSGGILHQFLQTDLLGSQFWYDSSLPVDFTKGTFVMEADLHVISSEYGRTIADGDQRSGYYLGTYDGFGRQILIGISSGGITINTDGALSPTQGVTFKNFDSTSGFHDYRFEVTGGTGSLFIDDSLFASTPVGDVIPNILGVPYRAFFGDAAGLTGSQTDLASFSAKYTGSVPDTGSSALLFGGAMASCFCLKRRFVKIS